MSWKFEHVYDSDGTELSNALVTTTLSGATDFCYDGRYVWVTCGGESSSPATTGYQIRNFSQTLTRDTLTNLGLPANEATTFTIGILLDGVSVTLNFQGSELSTFGRLIDAINDGVPGTPVSISGTTLVFTSNTSGSSSAVLVTGNAFSGMNIPGEAPLYLGADNPVNGQNSATTGGLAVYEFWGAASDNEPAFEDLDELIYPRYDEGLTKKLRLVTFIKITSSEIKRVTCLASLSESGATTYTQDSGETAYAKVSSYVGTALSPYYIQYCAGKVYVSNGANFTEIFEFDPSTHNYVRTISVGEVHAGRTTEFFTNGESYSMNSNLCSCDSKLWFTGSTFSDDAAQRLYGYDPLTDVKTTTDIPVRPTRTRTWLAAGNNGSVYLSNYNNMSISRFTTSTAAFGATIRINAFPTRIFGGPDRRIWVSSYAGMMSLVDWDDDGVHNNWGSEFAVLSAAVDPTDAAKLWFVRVDGTLVRLDLNTLQQFETGGANDWNMTHTKITGSPDAMMFTPSQVFTDAEGVDHDLEPYLFLIDDGRLLAFRMDKYLYRDVYAELHGQAAVVAGSLEYFGEV